MESPSSSPIAAQTFRRPGQQVVLFTVGSFFALLGAGILISGAVAADPAGTVIYTVVSAGGVWTAFRACVMGVRIDSTGLTARGLGRSKVIPWCVIGAVDTGDGPGPAPVQAPGLVLKNGEQAGLGALASYSSRRVDADFALIKSLHTTHVAACPNCA
ncbi:PH domain-containing protein [Streptomyces sp. NPDC096030]|uniref:PH domain-containing protein n=1 Tax=Streptomyces sp. NPDC096030 TaxID=3155423 RepID=UPI00332FDFB3